MNNGKYSVICQDGRIESYDTEGSLSVAIQNHNICFNEPTLYAIHYNYDSKHNELHKINMSNGQSQLLKSFDFESGYWQAEIHTSKNYISAISSANTIYTFNLEGTLVSEIPIENGDKFQKIAFNSENMAVGIQFNEINQKNEIYSIDLSYGKTTFLNAFTFDTGYWHPSTLKLDAENIYAFSTSFQLYKFNLKTGAIESITQFPDSIDFTKFSIVGEKLISIKERFANQILIYNIQTGNVIDSIRPIPLGLNISSIKEIKVKGNLAFVTTSEKFYKINLISKKTEVIALDSSMEYQAFAFIN